MNNGGRLVQEVLHSKMKTRKWPNFTMVLQKIHSLLPRMQQVIVELFHEKHEHIPASEQNLEDLPEMSNLEVTLKPHY